MLLQSFYSRLTVGVSGLCLLSAHGEQCYIRHLTYFLNCPIGTAGFLGRLVNHKLSIWRNLRVSSLSFFIQLQVLVLQRSSTINVVMPCYRQRGLAYVQRYRDMHHFSFRTLTEMNDFHCVVQSSIGATSLFAHLSLNIHAETCFVSFLTIPLRLEFAVATDIQLCSRSPLHFLVAPW